MIGSPVFRYALTPSWAGNELWRRARTVPSLDLRFADNKSLVDATTGQNLVTFTRASSGTYVGSDGLIKTATTNEPRFDHNPTTGESLGLLVEEQRTNLLLRSQEFGTTWSTVDASITPDTTTAPNGTVTADKLIENTVNATHRTFQSVAIASPYTLSCSFYAKAGERSRVGIWFRGASSTNRTQVTFNLSTGLTSELFSTGLFSGGVASMTAVGDGWYRCSLSANCAAGETAAQVTFYLMNNTVTISNATYIGDGASGIYLWGAQLEAGSFPTSYIPTTTATVTRSADVASITGTNFSSWYRQDEGTIYGETQIARQNDLGGAAICGIETGVANTEAIYMHYRTTGATAFTVWDGSVTQADQAPYGVVPANTLVRQAGAVKLNDMVGIGGGVSQTTDTACTVPTPDRMLIGFNTAGSAYLSGTIRRLTFWPQRLSNSTLQTLTQP